MKFLLPLLAVLVFIHVQVIASAASRRGEDLYTYYIGQSLVSSITFYYILCCKYCKYCRIPSPS